MQASLVDLRLHTKEVMRAIERRETVDIYSRGKLKARMVPPDLVKPRKATKRPSIMADPLFGYRKGDPEPVQEKVRRLRERHFDR
jgi:antitoxin (DNA-binding transcriptional repressor) of toxin-antitoxin stability system